MKKIWKLLILAVVLMALLVTYHFAAKSGKADAAEETKNSAGSIFTADQNDIKEISVSVSGDSYTLQKTDDGWKSDRIPETNKEKIQLIVDELSALKAERTLSSAQALSTYGLDQPKCTVSFQTSDGTKHTLKFGNATAVNSMYYMLFDDADTVYCMSETAYQQLAVPAKDMASGSDATEGTAEKQG